VIDWWSFVGSETDNAVVLVPSVFFFEVIWCTGARLCWLKFYLNAAETISIQGVYVCRWTAMWCDMKCLVVLVHYICLLAVVWFRPHSTAMFRRGELCSLHTRVSYWHWYRSLVEMPPRARRKRTKEAKQAWLMWHRHLPTFQLIIKYRI
jgi:hypothetical protein